MWNGHPREKWARDSNQQITGEDIQMAKKYRQIMLDLISNEDTEAF